VLIGANPSTKYPSPVPPSFFLYKPSLNGALSAAPLNRHYLLTSTHAPRLFSLCCYLIPIHTMSLRTARTAMSSLRNSSSASKHRLSQVQRHFSATASARQEIQEAYILSASRTPTGKVRSKTTILLGMLLTFPVQWIFHNSIRSTTRRSSHQIRHREVKSSRFQDHRCLHGKCSPGKCWTSPS
jgi:hypothetical protein